MFVTLQRIKPNCLGDCFPFLENESICYRSLFRFCKQLSQGPDVHLRDPRSGIG
jgi:hypothetical protein